MALVLLFILARFAFQGKQWMRPAAYVFASIMLVNGLLHTIGTLLGHTVESVRFSRPMPGFYSSPLLLAASFYLLWTLSRQRRSRF
jgi:hypothetical protein